MALALAACGSGGEVASAGDQAASPETVTSVEGGSSSTDVEESPLELPTIVVTTNVLGDVVSEVVGDAATVITIIPVGVDPHDFQPSAREIDELMRADGLIVNGGAYEEGFLDVIDAAIEEGVPTFEALSAVSTIEYADEHGHDEHDHSGQDPHFFTDPARMAIAVDGIVDFLQETIEFADVEALDVSTEAYVEALAALDADVVEIVAGLSDEQRILVTNHQVFGYFADRYDFEVVGAVIPSGTTLDTTSGGELDALADLIEAEGVQAIFSDASASDELIQTLAAEVGDVDVISLYTESLGESGSDGGTYLDMVRTNAERIAEGLG